MTQYWDEHGNQAQAGFAYNAGLLLVQYLRCASTLPEQDRYDATQTICVLQSLLTGCEEFIGAMQTNSGPLFGARVESTLRGWGLMSRPCIQVNTFPDSVTVEDLLAHLRHALSHPTFVVGPTNVPSTGWRTCEDDSGNISEIVFTHAPGRRKCFVLAMPLDTAKELAKLLANHLAQAVQDWDGKTVRPMVA